MPSISFPTGGGAIRGIGEKFAANPVTGTGSVTVPIATSPGRSGFGPELSLTYDSGSGNGPFGFGWSLSLPRITRKTDKGLPQYRDAAESDVFVLSGAEDLVPVYRQHPSADWLATHPGHSVDSSQEGAWVRDLDGKLVVHEDVVEQHIVRRYRPRIEGLFARIERWTHTESKLMHWRSISRDNVTTLYGADDNSCIRNPKDAPERPTHIFEWLICQSYDDKGNAIVYEYAAENGERVNRMQTNERNRLRSANRYLKRVKYGNRVSRLLARDLSKAEWHFEVVFDYGEEHFLRVPLDETKTEAEQHRFIRASASSGSFWPSRPDPFSSYRPGFEVRCYRRCHRVLMFHHFPELGAEPCLVRSTEFDYNDALMNELTGVDEERQHAGSTRFASFITRVLQSGYVRVDSDQVQAENSPCYATYLEKSLPPLEFEYSKAQIQNKVVDLHDANVPAGIDGGLYQLVDLDGEGIPGLLTKQGGAWQYKSGLGDGKFGGIRALRTQPSLFAQAANGEQLLDLSGNGQIDVVAFSGETPGFYERTDNFDWKPFRAFVQRANIDLADPNLRFVDLTGDGHADLLITEEHAFLWYPSLAEQGFDSPRRQAFALDEETGARLVFSDGTQSIYLADMSGDGLTDLVRIKNGEVSYWPNLGYGRFGAKVAMDNSPVLDAPEHFDQSRIRVADIDGSGTNDLLYIAADGVRIYFNQSGNAWSEAHHLKVFPKVDNISSVTLADLRGNGTACLVWSSPLPGDTKCSLRYVDLMGADKPHLLVRTSSNLGAETRIAYSPSTKFYLADKLAGKPWVTRIPFPVHVIERVETLDRISGNRFVTSYEYHHGYFEGDHEREFRGFGMVEQKDTEEFGLFAAGSEPGGSNLDRTLYVPPVVTKTWFHTGAYIERDRISDYFSGRGRKPDGGEYFREPGVANPEERLLPDTILPIGLSDREAREACRALKGMMLRQEVYALDGSQNATSEELARTATPYTVLEQNFTIRLIQPAANNRHAVFLTHPREAITYNYERNPVDPRVGHALTLEVDDFGNVLKQAAIAYGRKDSPLTVEQDQSCQQTDLLTYSESTFTNAIDAQEDYRAPLPCDVSSFELSRYPATGQGGRYAIADLVEPDPERPGHLRHKRMGQDPFEEISSGEQRRRLVERVRTLYRSNDLESLCKPGELESLALPGESYKLALTPSLLGKVFKRSTLEHPDETLLPDPVSLLVGRGEDQGGHIYWDEGWWTPTGKQFYRSDVGLEDPATTAAIELEEARKDFFLQKKISDPFRKSTVVEYDEHRLLIARTTDAVGNEVSAKHDYRVLQPTEVTDLNRNRTQVAFDALGLVVATAQMGKSSEAKGDRLEEFEADLLLAELQAFAADPHARSSVLLRYASTRIVYDLARYQRSGQPPFAATLSRETHYEPKQDNVTKIQIGFVFSDGFGREVQKKVQAESGDAPKRGAPIPVLGGDLRPGDLLRDETGELVQAKSQRRWVGSGRTVFNNKGKPVKQYEPFFSSTHLFENEAELTDTGVTPVLFYDPVGRVIATLHPNHTYEKVVFGAWFQRTFDTNDTCAARGRETGDPRTDPDIRGYVEKYFSSLPSEEGAEPWETWYSRNYAIGANTPQRAAALKAKAHSDTPTTLHLDPLGRPFLTIEKSRVVCAHHKLNGTEREFSTRVVLDIKGSQREVKDALNRIVMRYDYDLLGNLIHQASMEAGERWTLSDALGKPIRAWDSRGFLRRWTYDALRRPTALFVTDQGAERQADRTIYGEEQGEEGNHRGQIYQHSDGAGTVTNERFDFKSNLEFSTRTILEDYKSEVDWSQNPATTGDHRTETKYDALNRPISVETPDRSRYLASFNEANLLESVKVHLYGEGQPTTFIEGIDYDAKGQRTEIRYGNKATTKYSYEKETFRLIHLLTTRNDQPADPASALLFKSLALVQSLYYTYDPAGNITSIEDAALKKIQGTEPRCTYTYDSVYRLIEATGREHTGQNAFVFAPENGNRRDYPFAGHQVHANDVQHFRKYTQRYVYDSVGNFDVFVHRATGDNWKRQYWYEETSLLEEGLKSNRLTRTEVGNGALHKESYRHDHHGNMNFMSHLGGGNMKPNLHWDFKDQLVRADLGGGGTAYYRYDSSGQRVRKVIESKDGVLQKERLYLGGVEIYREYGVDSVGSPQTTLERQSHHIMDDRQRVALVERQTKPKVNLNEGNDTLVRYQMGNHLGSSSVELDHAGALIAYEEYHPYGTTSFQAGRSSTEVSQKRYRFTAMERDEESGLSYHSARYYAPWLGRWVASDPHGLADGPSLYVYCRTNPLMFDDLTGASARDLVTTIRGWIASFSKESDDTAALPAVYDQWSDVDVAIDIGTISAPIEGEGVTMTVSSGEVPTGIGGQYLVDAMLQLQRLGLVYWFPRDPKATKSITDEVRADMVQRPLVRFVNIGGSSTREDGTTNCSTAVLEAIFVAFGGRQEERKRPGTFTGPDPWKHGKQFLTNAVGGAVNGVALDDPTYRNFASRFQGPDWVEALVDAGFGVRLNPDTDVLVPGDILGSGSHRFLFIATLPSERSVRRIRVLDANLTNKKQGQRAIDFRERTVEAAEWSNLKAARLNDFQPRSATR